MTGRFRYWRHIRSGEVVAVVLNDGGIVISASPTLPLREVARQFRTDMREDVEHLAALNLHRADWRNVPPTQIEMLRHRYGGVV